MLIECATCVAKACADCVVSTLLPDTDTDTVPEPIELDDTELEALGLLAELGMIPPLRHDRAS